MGGETYRGRNTGQRRTRPAFQLPCTPHHNADAAMLSAQKNRFSAVVRYVNDRVPTPGSRICGCAENIAPGQQWMQAVFWRGKHQMPSSSAPISIMALYVSSPQQEPQSAQAPRQPGHSCCIPSASQLAPPLYHVIWHPLSVAR